MDNQLSNLAVTGEEIALIRGCLENMRQEMEATSILLLDTSGQVIASLNRRGAPPETTVGALLAATFSGSRELAKVLHETDFRTHIQQGERESIFAELVGDQWILGVIFSKPTLLGMVKVISHKAVIELTKVLQLVKTNSRQRDRFISDKMRDSLSSTLDLLFDGLEGEKPTGTSDIWERAT